MTRITSSCALISVACAGPLLTGNDGYDHATMPTSMGEREPLEKRSRATYNEESKDDAASVESSVSEGGTNDETFLQEEAAR
jgi:hypothetical protein